MSTRNTLLSLSGWGQDPGASASGGAWAPQLPPSNQLTDFARLVETFDAQPVSFVSLIRQFNTTSSIGG
jgi:hypothetical protein